LLDAKYSTVQEALRQGRFAGLSQGEEARWLTVEIPGKQLKEWQRSFRLLQHCPHWCSHTQASQSVPMSHRLELFSARVCPYAHRTRLILREKDVAFEYTEVDLQNKPSRFLAVSPYGKVPALVHDGATVYESAIINEYLDETFQEPRLMPETPVARAKVRIWIDYCDDYFIADHYALLKNQDAARHPTLLHKAERNFRFIEQEGLAKLSGNGPYWLGSELSLLDFAWYPFFERLPAWTHYRGLKIPDDCPRLQNWVETMAPRQSIREIANDAAYYVGRYVNYAKTVLP
jgi:glutathione S-transferase